MFDADLSPNRFLRSDLEAESMGSLRNGGTPTKIAIRIRFHDDFIEERDPLSVKRRKALQNALVELVPEYDPETDLKARSLELSARPHVLSKIARLDGIRTIDEARIMRVSNDRARHQPSYPSITKRVLV